MMMSPCPNMMTSFDEDGHQNEYQNQQNGGADI